MRRVLIPGSFDPVTLGHLDLIRYAAATYDQVTVGLFRNVEKTYLLTEEQRMELIRLACRGLTNVDVVCSDGYTADFAKEHGYSLILRGYRDEEDLAYEKRMAAFNLARDNVQTELRRTSGALAHVSSTRVREALLAGDQTALATLVPPACVEPLLRYVRGDLPLAPR
jgi:pantetheine-phosphate adenylyltransferase